MACLYCGKEVGPLRLIRDSEFCSEPHRTAYKKRLRRVLTQVGEPEACATALAPFLDASHAQDGNPRSFVPSLSFQFSVRIPVALPVRATPLQGSHFSPLNLTGIDDVSTRALRGTTDESYCSFEQKTPEAPPELPQAQLGRAIPAAADAPAAIAPDSRTDALETSPANTWLAPCPPLQAPTELPPVRGVSGLREHPLANPVSIRYSIAYKSTRAASLAESSFSHGEQPALPELHLNALPSEQILDASRPLVPRGQVEQFASLPGAMPAASFIAPSVQRPVETEYAPFVPKGPRLAPVVYPTASNRLMPPPIAYPVESLAEPAASTELINSAAALWVPQITGRSRLRIFELPASNAWMPGLESQPAARIVHTAKAGVCAYARKPIQYLPFGIEVAKRLETSQHSTRFDASFPIPAPVPVESPRTAGAYSPAAISLAPLRFASFAIEAIGGSPAAPAGFLSGPAAFPVEAARIAPPLTPVAVVAQPALILPEPQVAADVAKPSCDTGGFQRQSATAAIPPTRILHRSAALEPVMSSEPLAVPSHPAATSPMVPTCPARPLASAFSKVQGQPQSDLKWFGRDHLDLELPRFGLRPVFERFETFVDLTKLEHKRSNVFDFADYEQIRKHKPILQHAGKAIAAALLVAVGLWFGAHAANLGRRIVSRDATSELARIENSARVGSGTAQQPSTHFVSPVIWAKGAIAKRAAVQVTDSFDEGMRAWGAAAKSWAPGWSRNSDGYVTPGQLALLKPTLAYTDYRLEFFGQIEKKGMSWAVRAHDPQNYYAMKFKVVEPGLRPILSMVHYAVVGGKIGQKVEVPLAVMVHNNTPYHVAVQVRGHQYTASIEGQPVESWMDDALPSGGVGFFSEAGEKARLYWMKVYKNDDWLGRVCAYLSGSSVEDSQETAWLERQQVPGPAPSRREPIPSEAVLLADGTSEYFSGRPQRTNSRVLSQGRNRIWNS